MKVGKLAPLVTRRQGRGRVGAGGDHTALGPVGTLAAIVGVKPCISRPTHGTEPTQRFEAQPDDHAFSEEDGIHPT